MKCIKCNEPLEPGWQVCPVCESPVIQIITCSTCGKELKINWVKCPGCQTPTGKQSGAKPSPMAGGSMGNSPSGYSMGMAQSIVGQTGTIIQVALNPGDQVGNYTIKKKLGQGGFGSVYMATEGLLEEDHALKVLPLISRDNVKNILLEFKSRERIKDFDHIIKAWQPQPAVYQGQDILLYPMELADMTFRQWLIEHKNNPETVMKQGIDIFKQACYGVEEIHNAGLTHLDIKPENILLIKDPVKKGQWIAKIADFGLSRGVGMEGLAALEDGMGTAAYMAPEQIMAARWKDVGREADIYALGMILYEMIDGDLPYSGTPRQIKDKKRHKDIEIAPLKQQHAYAKTAMVCLERNPLKRFASVTELLDALTNKAKPEKKSAQSKPSKPKEEKVSEPKTLQIRIITRPAGVKLYVDNAPAVNTPISLHLVPGKHWLKMTRAGRVHEETILVDKSSPSEFNFEMEDYGDFTEITNNLNIEMVLVEGGTFNMGVTLENEVMSDERPAHQVTLSKFYLAKYPITQKQWKAVMGENPSYFKGDNRPVECVSWDDAQVYIRNLNSLTGKNYRLPTEAEWEYAAHGGNNGNGFKYSGSDNLDDVGWYSDNSGNETQSVGKKKANELGLHDMSGNLMEWCSDWYDKYYFSSTPEHNPQGPTSGSSKVSRGGSWSYKAHFCHVTKRRCCSPGIRNRNFGFRIVLSI